MEDKFELSEVCEVSANEHDMEEIAGGTLVEDKWKDVIFNAHGTCEGHKFSEDPATENSNLLAKIKLCWDGHKSKISEITVTVTCYETSAEVGAT